MRSVGETKACAVAVAIALATAVHAPLASAQASATPSGMIEAHPPPTRRSFYGWPIVGVGEVGAMLTSAALVLPDQLLTTTASTAAFIIGVPTFVLGAPIVHWSHGDFEKGIISVAANVTLPLIGGATGRAIACSGEHAPDCGYRGFGAGLAITVLVIPLVDALVLGWEDVPADEGAAAPRGLHVASFAILPGRDGNGRTNVQLFAGGTF
jgi:hypothetical protein